MPKSIAGIDQPQVHVIRNVTDIERLKAAVDAPGIEEVAVIGGGFIGLEAAENLSLAGKKVTLVEGMDQVMTPFDHDMVQILHKELDDMASHCICDRC
ncbi:MAG: FAD/NAD(P)-binding oxidoreductase [Merdibacter sp.]